MPYKAQNRQLLRALWGNFFLPFYFLNQISSLIYTFRGLVLSLFFYFNIICIAPLVYSQKANYAMYKNSPSHFRDATGLKQQGRFTFYAFLYNFFCKPFH